MKTWVIASLFVVAGCNPLSEEKKPLPPQANLASAAPGAAPAPAANAANPPAAVPPKKDVYGLGELARCGTVTVSVIQPKMGTVQLGVGDAAKVVPTSKTFLLIYFKVANDGPEPFAYQHPGKDEIRVSDDLGNTYLNEDAPNLDVRGQVKTQLLEARRSFSDFVAFDLTPLTPSASRLYVELLAGRFNGTPGEILKFSIPAPGKRDPETP
jgi:hypothetical protein